VADKIRLAAGGNLSGKIVAVWGLTFKAGTDDLRDSPAIAIIERLMKLGARVQAYDPTVNVVRPGIPNDLVIAASCGKATTKADVLAVLTEWDEFKWVSASETSTHMTGKQIIDARNLLDRKDWERAGFTYQGIGR
jgi:UDPglucose 6-dehydrogenase